MRILLAGSGTDGDIRPLLALGMSLRSTGHEIRICAPPNNEQAVKSLGFDFFPLGMDVQAALKEHADTVMGHPIKGLKTFIEVSNRELTLQFSGLTEASEGVDFIVGAGALFVGRSVADYRRVPYCHIFHMPQALASRHHPPITVSRQDLPLWANHLLWEAMRISMNALRRGGLNTSRKQLGMDGIGDLWPYCYNRVIMAADKALASIPPDVRVDCVQTAYLHFPEEEALAPEIEAFIQAGSPPVYIGFGSMTDPSPEKTAKALKELVNSSEQRFIISKGWANLGQAIEAENLLVIGHAPHSKLFPAMSAIVHHGGAGTVHTAARAGVPQVVVPHVFDQYYWGERIYRLKLGPRPVKRSELTSGNLLQAIQEAVSGSEIKSRARATGEQMRTRDGIKEAVAQLDIWLEKCRRQ